MIIRMTLLLVLILLTGYIEAKAVPVIKDYKKLQVCRLELLIAETTGLKLQSTSESLIIDE